MQHVTPAPISHLVKSAEVNEDVDVDSKFLIASICQSFPLWSVTVPMHERYEHITYKYVIKSRDGHVR